MGRADSLSVITWGGDLGRYGEIWTLSVITWVGEALQARRLQQRLVRVVHRGAADLLEDDGLAVAQRQGGLAEAALAEGAPLLRAEQTEVRAGLRHCAVSSEQRVSTREAKTVEYSGRRVLSSASWTTEFRF